LLSGSLAGAEEVASADAGRVGACRARLRRKTPLDWRRSATVELINAESFTIGGEAIVLAPDGLSRFEELPRSARLPRRHHHKYISEAGRH
jgi:hypothetical protein